MSAGLPYLKSLRKSDLVVLADVADLKDYEDYKKTELESALDEHLSANREIFSGEQRLSDYYRRLSHARIASPVKREPKPDGPLEDVKKSVRGRRQTKSIEANEESDSPTPAKALVPSSTSARTPARSPLSFASLPPSPAVVTDVIDRQTAAARRRISETWEASGLTEQSDSLRSTLSSVSSIETLIIAIELWGLHSEVLPSKYLTTIPAIPALHTPDFPVKVPDLFLLLSGSFWAPFSLWFLTSLLLPLTTAYFFNLSMKASQQSSHGYGTRRGASPSVKHGFDPLVFNISKALVSYLVYANHFNFWDAYSHLSVQRVGSAVPGGWPGLLTGAAIGGVGSIYEAILRK